MVSRVAGCEEAGHECVLVFGSHRVVEGGFEERTANSIDGRDRGRIRDRHGTWTCTDNGSVFFMEAKIECWSFTGLEFVRPVEC